MGAKILVVDDEPSLLRLTGFSLQSAGYEVVTAETAAEAMKRVEEQSPELVILDVMLPDRSGLDVCRDLRADPGTARLPVIMLSARAQVPDRVRGLKSGADEYVTKPVDSDELVARVERLLERVRETQPTAPPQRPRGQVHVFVGAKGGVGTTTVAQYVAQALARERKGTVTALELKASADTLTSQLGISTTDHASPWTDLDPSAVTENALRERLVEHGSGLKILPGLQQINAYNELNGEQARAVVAALAAMSEHTIVDLACHPSAASRSVIPLADQISLIVEPDPLCLLSGKATLELLKTWGASEERMAAVVVNRAGVLVPALLTQILPDVESRLGCRVLGVIPPSLGLVMNAFKIDSSVVSLEQERPFVTSLSELAARMTDGVPASPQDAISSS